jgi:hypothetical protein
MQLTARQRYFARIMVGALPVSAALGAGFGGFRLPNDIIRGCIRGAVAGTLISTLAVLLEFVVFSRTLSALVRRIPFLLYLALRSLGYLVAILMGLAVSAWLVRTSAESEPLIEPGSVIFSLVLSLGFNLLYGVNSLLGEGVLFNFIAGRYRRPRIEECALLFIGYLAARGRHSGRSLRERLPNSDIASAADQPCGERWRESGSRSSIQGTVNDRPHKVSHNNVGATAPTNLFGCSMESAGVAEKRNLHLDYALATAAATRADGEVTALSLRHFRCHLRIAHSLFTVETPDHFDRCSHVGCKLKHADALRNPHAGVGVPERVGDALLSIGPAKNSSLIEDLFKPLFETSDGSTFRSHYKQPPALLSCPEL